ncbi:MAG: hypothetical protein EOO38_24050, partial [Cytophagaceae bacterium]
MYSVNAPRSLYNNNVQNTTSQANVLALLLQCLNNPLIGKIVRNAAVYGSTVDDTQIGSITPNQARFTSLTAGVSGMNFPFTLYGPDNSQVTWRNGRLSLLNTGISTPVLSLDAFSKIAWSD